MEALLEKIIVDPLPLPKGAEIAHIDRVCPQRMLRVVADVFQVVDEGIDMFGELVTHE